MNKPNFIMFLTDDQGYGDLSCMGATDFKTPHLDRMAANGVRFTDCQILPCVHPHGQPC